MLFTYWHSKDLGPIASSVAHWRATFPDFRVVDDAEVEAILQRSFRDYLGMYRRLRIPAARSDVARLADAARPRRFLCRLPLRHDPDGRGQALRRGAGRARRAAGADGVGDGGPGPAAPERADVRGRGAPPAWPQALARGLENLARRMAEEDRRDAEGAYDIFELIGARNLRAVLLADPFTLRAEFTGQVRLAAEDEAPFRRNVFKSYQGPGAHWSERQRCEPLFLPPG